MACATRTVRRSARRCGPAASTQRRSRGRGAPPAGTRPPARAARGALVATCTEVIHAVAREQGLGVEVTPLMDHPPVPLTPHVRTAVAAAAQAEGLRHLAMPSGAGHDSQIMA